MPLLGRRCPSSRNIACIVNLHQLDVAMRYATRIIGLAKGEMIFDGTPQQLNNAVPMNRRR